MKLTIFGGAGYLGSTMTPHLLSRGHEVTVVDALIYGRSGAPLDPDVRFVEEDFRDDSVVRDAVRGADAVIHLGGFVGEPACDLDPALTLESSVAAPLLAARRAREAGVGRFLFASTCSVYGISDGWADEDTPPRPVSLYGRGKVATEQALAGLADDDFRVLVLRMGTAYGLSPRPRFDSVVNLMTARLSTTGTVPVRGGRQWRPFVHVADIAAAFAAGAELRDGVPAWDAVNVGSDQQNLTIAELADVVHRTLGRGRVELQPAPEDARDYRVRFDKIRRVLGFRPAVGLVEGIAQMAAAIEGGSVGDPFDRRYDNYRGLVAAVEAGRVRPTGSPELLACLPPLPADGDRDAAMTRSGVA